MLSKIENVYKIDSYSHKNRTNWNEIKNSKFSYRIDDDPSVIDHLVYPGFVFSNENDKMFYESNILSLYSNENTTPRGNLSILNEWIICGIKPGADKSDAYSKYVSYWLFGKKSSFILHKLLYDLNIYPYFTNIYSHFNDTSENIENIYTEISLLTQIIKKPKLLVLGNYKEYIMLCDKFKKHNINIDVYKMWHPSYIARNGLKNYYKWKSSFMHNKLY